MRILILLLYIVLAGCDTKGNYPSFWLDKDIKYRIHYGILPFEFIDIARSGCVNLNGKLSCEHEDFSPIRKIRNGNSFVQGQFLEIWKEHSHWFLCNINIPSEMYLENNNYYDNYGEWGEK